MSAIDEQNGLTGLYELVYARPEHTAVRVPGRIGEASPADNSVAELQWRLLAIRAVLEREGQALARHHDERLLDVLVEIDERELSIAKTLGLLARWHDS